MKKRAKFKERKIEGREVYEFEFSVIASSRRHALS
jgi:hypothetical protein